MKQRQPIIDDIRRLEAKVNLLNDKLDRLMEAQGIKLEKTPEQVDKEEEKKRKVRERQQAKVLREQQFKVRTSKIVEDLRLCLLVGYELQAKFNLLTRPSADRIRQYQQTNNPRAFDGLKRRNNG
ncbi:hypothetical protein AB6805_13970 [Chitinophaga sp. RCC_12]|uniref:hypothetical protein n=1 Tax=Chitinophaga sp. RCC_12 TaxID=3239226 RepID=UPI0035255D4C